jgi:PAS domain S-box-containing protein
MARKQNSAISKLHKERITPSQSPPRKSINSRLTSGGKIRSLKSSTVTRSFQAVQAQVTEHKQKTEEPRKSEERYRTILEEMEEGYFETDLAGNLTFINDAGCRNLGYSREELTGKNNRMYADEENAKKVFQAFNKAYQTGQPCRVFDYEIIRKDGTKATVELSVSLMRDSGGKLVGFRGIARHITERKKAEEALLNAAQQWRATFDGISDIVCLLDQGGRIVRCNKAMTDLLGKPFGEIINRTHLEILHGAPMLIEECPVERLWKTHRRETDILLINDRWYSIAVDPLLEEAGRLIGAVHIMSDVTERKRAEEAIRESEKRYKQVIENAVDIIYTTDANGNFTHANPAALMTTGYSLEELQRFNYLDVILPEHRDRVSKIYISQFRHRQVTTYVEFPFFNKSGDVLWFGQNASLVIEGENPVGFHVIARDITERKRAEEALRHSEERYRTILESIEDGYYEEDLAGNFVFFNEVMCRIYGYPKEELLGLNYKKYTSEETAKRLFQIFNEIYRTGNPCKEYSYELIRKDGVKRYIEASASLIKDSADKPAGFRGIVRDVTERKKSDEKFTNLVTQAPIGISTLNNAGTYKYVNPKFTEIFGYTLEDIPTGKIWFEKAHPDPEYRRMVLNTWKGDLGPAKVGEAPSRVFTVTCKDGSQKEILFKHVALTDESHLVAYEDITDLKQAEDALRESEEKYRNILDSIQDGYSEVDLGGNFTFVNNMTCKHLGYTKEELIGMNYHQYTSEENARKIKKLYTEVYKTGKPIDLTDHELISKDGTTATYEFSVSLIRNAEGNPIGFRQTSRDITERKRAEEALRQSEERYRNILETMQEAYYETDFAGHFTFVNDALCRHLGYSKEELIGKVFRQFQDEANAKKMYQAFNEIYRTGEPVKALEAEYIRKDGTKGTYEVSASLIRDAQDKPIGFRGVSRDVTERKQAEEALRRSEERYRTIIENIQDGYFENDLAGNFTFANDVICRNLGYTREESIGMNYRQYTDEEHRKNLLQQYGELYRTGQPIKPFEAGYVGKDGTKLLAEISVSLIWDPEGKPIGFRGISRDITERKRAEEEKLSLQEQLRQSQKMEAIGQLAGGVAHDFNNLLTVIKGYSQLSLLDVKEDNPLWGNIQEIEKATQRATDLTRQLLAFSRRQILNPKVLDLNALLKDLEKMLRRLIGEDIELVTLLSGDLGKVKVDPSQIEQVIFNLAVNARDAMPSGGKLAIATANVELDEGYARAHVSVTPGRYVSLSVSDTGIGMTQEVKEKVFDPFFTTKEKAKGTGLGLSMVYGIVKQSSGNIWVYSELGRGTTFKIYLPRTEEEADSLQGREETDFFPRGTETVLLVEDEELVRDLATRLLEQQGYRVLKAANGQEALLVGKEHVGETIHLLLADIVMPHMGGKELADWLKISRPNVKVLYTSGYADDAIVHQGVLDPGTHFLQKPFSLKTLSHKVREVLDG